MPRWRPLDYPKIDVETAATDEDISRMVSEIGAAWSKMGELDPYFTNVAHGDFATENIAANKEKFLRTGLETLSHIEAIASRQGIDLRTYRDCFELGCEVGPITRALAGAFDTVYGMDASASHLRVAREALAETRSRVTLRTFNSIASIDSLPQFDLFVFFAVLQHNPPPLAAKLLDKVLAKVRYRGAACFECLTYHPAIGSPSRNTCTATGRTEVVKRGPRAAGRCTACPSRSSTKPLHATGSHYWRSVRPEVLPAVSRKSSSHVATTKMSRPGGGSLPVDTAALTPSVGVEFTGVTSVATLFDDVVIARLLAALKWRGVVVIRGLHLDDESQLAFTRMLGDVAAPEGSEIFKVTFDPAQNANAQYLKANRNWHIDGYTPDIPAKTSILTARRIGSGDAGTEFANTYAAWEGLPIHERKRYEGLRVMHTFKATQRPYDASSERTLHRTAIMGDEAWC